jgi:hypothetical protein
VWPKRNHARILYHHTVSSRASPIFGLDQPLVQSVVVPLVAAFVIAGAGRLAGGLARTILCGAAIALGFLAAYTTIFGLPPIMPRSAGQKIASLAMLAIVAGAVVDAIRFAPATRRALLLVAAAAGLLWLLLPLLRGPDAANLLRAASVLVLGLLIIWRSSGFAHDAQSAGTILVVAGAGLAGVAVLGASVSLAQLAAALAAAAGGFMLWNWPVRRDSFEAIAVLGGFGVLAALIGQGIAFTRMNPAALAVLACVVFADRIARRAFPRASPQSALFAFAIAGAAILPAAAAIALAYVFGGARSPY